MSRLVECVPNFSEGNDREAIDAIGRAISQTAGCALLDVDAGPSTNRTVYTFVGPPDAVVEGALAAARVAFQLLDMSKHRGEHPRMGALDVCPKIPVRDVTMDEARAQVSPPNFFSDVYIYGEGPAWQRTTILSGQWRIWCPFHLLWGPLWSGSRLSAFCPCQGASCKWLGVRPLIGGLEKEAADPRVRPGRLRKVQGIGWYLEEKNLAQVSTNLLDFEITALHTVYEETCKDAQELNLPVVGSQLVGLVPLKALLDAADFYCQKEKLFILEEEHKIRLVGRALSSRVGWGGGVTPSFTGRRTQKLLAVEAQSLGGGRAVETSLRGAFPRRGSSARSPPLGTGSKVAAMFWGCQNTLSPHTKLGIHSDPQIVFCPMIPSWPGTSAVGLTSPGKAFPCIPAKRRRSVRGLAQGHTARKGLGWMGTRVSPPKPGTFSTAMVACSSEKQRSGWLSGDARVPSGWPGLLPPGARAGILAGPSTRRPGGGHCLSQTDMARPEGSWGEQRERPGDTWPAPRQEDVARTLSPGLS
uniref:glutamate formimidoyltransferase n=1 Tax=Monodelphis domestica TaxID=13616 RepID=A0A5F8GKH8_MONDO